MGKIEPGTSAFARQVGDGEVTHLLDFLLYRMCGTFAPNSLQPMSQEDEGILPGSQFRSGVNARFQMRTTPTEVKTSLKSCELIHLQCETRYLRTYLITADGTNWFCR